MKRMACFLCLFSLWPHLLLADEATDVESMRREIERLKAENSALKGRLEEEGVLAGGESGDAASALKEDYFSRTEIQLLATFGRESNRTPRSPDDDTFITTLEHFSTWKYGSNFFFVDIAGDQGFSFYDNGNIGIYLEYYPTLSSDAIFDIDYEKVSWGALKDIQAIGGFNWGRSNQGFDFGRVWLGGAQFDWNVPYFSVFSTQIMYRDELNFEPTWQFTWVFESPHKIGEVDFLARGFLDIYERNEESGLPGDSLVVIFDPQTLISLGWIDSTLENLWVGVEWEYTHDFGKRGLNTGSDFAISPMVRWKF